MHRMKVYVDELPKCCGDCVFCKQTEYYYYCDKLNTKLGYFDKDTDCPLISLAEHDKQVRKEVVQEIRQQLKPHYGEEIAGVVVEEVLEKVEKEQK